MREIKFRGLDFKNNWVYGTYYFGVLYPTSFKGHYIEDTLIDENTIGQFTGLYDKNNIECYDGDIIKYKYYEPGKIMKGVAKVQYDNGAYFLSDLHVKRNYPMYLADLSFEIIGNIHQNKDLLK